MREATVQAGTDAWRDAACYRRNIGLPRVRDDRLDAIIHKCDNRRN